MLGTGLKPNAGVTDVSFRAALSIVKVLNAGVDVATDNTAQSLVCPITSTGSATHPRVGERNPGIRNRFSGRTHRIQFTAHLEIRVRNAIGDCPGHFGSALEDRAQ